MLAEPFSVFSMAWLHNIIICSTLNYNIQVNLVSLANEKGGMSACEFGGNLVQVGS